jgi:ABC-2 type transport system permease protein
VEVARRDLTIYWRSPIALVVAAAFLVLEGASFTALVAILADPTRPAPLGAVLEGHFGGTLLHWTLQLTVLAALAARVVEDRRAGTWEALITAPVPEGAAIVGAWLASLGFYALLWIPTLAYVAVLVQFAPAGVQLDAGPLVSAYAGEVAIGAAGLALALAAGAWSTQPVVATVAGFGVLLAWLLIGELPSVQPELVGRYPVVASALDRSGPRAVLAAMARGEVRGESLMALAALTIGGLRIATAVAAVGRRRRGVVPVGVAEGFLLGLALSLAAVLVGRAGAQWDLTAAGRNSLEPATRTVLARIGDPMTATVVYPGIAELEPIFNEVERVIRRMTVAQPALVLDHWDPIADPSAIPAAAAVAAIDEQQLIRGGAVILGRGVRRRAVSLLDLASLDRDALSAPSVKTLRIEAALAQAIAELVDDAPVRVCATCGHGELRLEADDRGSGSWSSVAQRLRSDGMTVETTDLGGDVPSMCRVVVVIGPVAPLSSAEALAIAAFLDRGGGLLLALAGREVSADGGFEATGLETLLAAWGVTTPAAWVIDPSLAVSLPLALRVVDGYSDHPIAAGFAGRRYSVWQRARPVVVKDGVRLVHTTDAGWGETDLSSPPERDPRDLPGPIALAAAVERDRGSLVVIGSAEALAAHYADRGRRV